MIQARFQRFGALKAKGHLKEIQLRACSYVFYQDKGRQIKLWWNASHDSDLICVCWVYQLQCDYTILSALPQATT